MLRIPLASFSHDFDRTECPQPGTKAFDISTTEDVWKYERVFHFFFHTGTRTGLSSHIMAKGLMFVSRLSGLTSSGPSRSLDRGQRRPVHQELLRSISAFLHSIHRYICHH